MAANLYLIFLFIIISSIPQSSCQSVSPQNIQTFFPFPLSPPAPPSNSTRNQPPQSPPLLVIPTSSPSSKKTVGTAIGITAASTLILSGLFFFLLHRYSKRKKRDKTSPNPYAASPVLPENEFKQFRGNLKGLIVDEDGLDVIYWRKLEGEDGNKWYEKQVFKNLKLEEVEEKKIISKGDHRKYEPPRPQIPLLRGKSSTSESPIWNELAVANQNIASIPYGGISIKAVGKQDSSIEIGSRSPPPPPPPPPPPAPRAAVASVLPLAVEAVPKGKRPLPPPPPPIPARKGPPPPPMPKASSLGSSPSKPPPFPRGLASDSKGKQFLKGEGAPGNGNGQVKLKPLHWDKVKPNVDHSMVWDKIEGGSFK